MKIAVVGFGKMGRMVKSCAKSLGHEVVATIDVAADDASVKVPAGDGGAVEQAVKSSRAEGVIEFSHPSAVVGNVCAVLPLGIPIVVGTTGWDERRADIEKRAAECGGIVMSSANFSVGVNMFYKIVSEAARLMQPFCEYDVATWEMHHNQKADSPSGTAREIARRILALDGRKTEAVYDAFQTRPKAGQLHVSSTRCGCVPGTHTVFFDSPFDTIELTHRARSREGFAMGAVRALERLDAGIKDGTLSRGRLYGMDDLF